MKKLPVLISIFCLLAAVFMAFRPQTNKPTKNKMLRHVVMFKFKDNTTAQDIKTVEEAFRKLPSQIKEIKGFEWGTNNSPEKHSQGYTHVFFLSFADEQGREVYLPHPAHSAFGKVLSPHLDKVMVLDYWAQD